MDLSKRIKELREVKKISQSEMARLLGVEPTNYPRLEKRGDNLTFEWINKIATALGVSLAELLNIETPNHEAEKVKELEKRVAEIEELTDLQKKRIESLESAQERVLSEWFVRMLDSIGITGYGYRSIISNDGYFKLDDNALKKAFDKIVETYIETDNENNYIHQTLIFLCLDGGIGDKRFKNLMKDYLKHKYPD